VIPVKMGNKSRISTSKIKNTIATKKNRKEKGIRLSSMVENPHSNTLLDSRSRIFFFLNNTKNPVRKNPNTNLTQKKIIIPNIYSYSFKQSAKLLQLG